MRSGVDLWMVPLDSGDLNEMKRCLAPDELSRASRFVDSQLARHYIAARAGLRQILASYLACRPGDVRLDYAEFGKPILSASHAGVLHFNLSHAGGRAVYAVCDTAQVGVDVECDDSRVDEQELAPAICSPNELQQFLALPSAEQRPAFFRLWTRKEAFMKCLGHGLTIEPRSLAMPTEEAPEVFAGEGDVRCSVRTLKLGSGFQISVAVLSGESNVRSFRWWPDRTPILE